MSQLFKKHEMAGKMRKEERNSEGKIILKKPRMLTPEESAAKMKALGFSNDTYHAPSSKEKADYQKRIGRSWDD